MVLDPGRALLGDPTRRTVDLLAVAAAFVLTAAAYAVGAFEVAGGVVFVPVDATFAGLVAAASIGYRRGGLLPAWLAPFAAYLGLKTVWGLAWVSERPLLDRLEFILSPGGLALFGVSAAVAGTVGFLAGYALAEVAGAVGGGDA